MIKQQNSLLDKILQNRILSHSLFWLAIFLLAPFTSSERIKDVGEAYLFRGVAMPMKIIPTYFLVYYLIPIFYRKKKYIQFLVLFILSAFVFTVIYRFNNIHIAETLAGVNAPKESLWEIITQYEFTISAYFFRIYVFTIIFMIAKAIKDREVKSRQIEVLQKEKTEAELNFLKAQIHPHFLFNTLNNLYALTVNKSDDAPEVVEKLSEMLDYMLYQCRDPKVRISQEIELLQNYIALEKIRYGDRLQLNFEHKVDHPHTEIAPLMLISMVENAFKHGVSGAIQEAIVKIDLKVENGNLDFNVFNTKASGQLKPLDYQKGIGVKNIQRQLELTYPDQYTWNVNEEETSYEVNLTIKL